MVGPTPMSHVRCTSRCAWGQLALLAALYASIHPLSIGPLLLQPRIVVCRLRSLSLLAFTGLEPAQAIVTDRSDARSSQINGWHEPTHGGNDVHHRSPGSDPI